MKRRILICLVLVLHFVAPSTTKAQQQSLYTQYMFNGMVINPAYSATDDAMNATLLHRQQWVGLEGAPQTTTASFYAPIVDNKLSTGLVIAYDRIGINYGTGLDFSLAPMVNLSRDVKMALGLSAGLRHGISLFSSLDKTSDPLFAQNEQILYTMFGAGAMIFSDKFYVGVSLPQLINLKIKDHNNGIKGNRFFNYLYLTGGMLIPLSDQIDLKPNTLLWYSEDMKPQLDLNLNVILQKKLWVGVSWRSLESISGMFQIQIDKKLQVGYAYDAGTSISRTVSKGSHELLLSYRFMKNRRRVISTRWF